MNPFNIETAPLKGIYLLEANAGTGKTFSLSGLFLKFLYFEENLSIKNLVAITFTKSATQEIFSRIKSDLNYFVNIIYDHLTKEEKNNIEIDKLSFAYLLKDYRKLNPTEQKAKREHLNKCLFNFDEHNIHTIHGFAGKIISEYRFELSLIIGEKITQDDSPFFEEAFREFWRHYFLNIDPYFLSYFESKYPRKKWHKILQTLYRRPTLKLYPPLLDNEVVPGNQGKIYLEKWKQLLLPYGKGKGNPKEMERYQECYKELHLLWEALSQKINEIPLGLKRKWLDLIESNALDKRRTRKIIIEWERLENLIQEGRLIPFFYEVFNDPELISRFTTEKITSLFKKGYSPNNYIKKEVSTVIEQIDKLNRVITYLQDEFKKYALLLIHAAHHYIKEKSFELRVKKKVMSFNDLLEILTHHIHSPQGKNLIKQLSQAFPVILVDEFQDTDPLQFTIFRHLLPMVQATYFIADPKQSIYSFRQANIHTYLKAKGFMDKSFHLLANYRSNPLLLDGINHLYARHPAPFLIPQLKYHPSNSGFSNDEESTPPLKIIFSQINEKINTKKKRQKTAYLLIRDIGKVIKKGERIAILVRKRAHGFFIHSQLRNAGIMSVMEDIDNPFQTQEAHELYLLIKAILFCGKTTSNPITTYRDPRLLGALGTAFFLEEKIVTSSPYSEDELQEWLITFQEAQQKWEKQGWYLMIHELIRKAGIASRLLSQQDGDQRYRRLLQLIDIIHSWKGEYPEQVLRHFSNWLTEQEVPDTSEILPSNELAEDTVKVVTVHKSKGLEYDVVFLPYFDETLFPKKTDVIFKLAPDSLSDENDIGFLAYDLGSEKVEEHKNLSKQEILAEELRILYVALTRAKKSCYIYISLTNKYSESTLRYLFHPPSSVQPPTSGEDSFNNPFWENFKYSIDLAAWKKELNSLGNHPAISFCDVSSELNYDHSDTSPVTLNDSFPSFELFQPFKPFGGVIYSEGFQTSFSAMTNYLSSKPSDKMTFVNEPEEEQIDDLAHEPTDSPLIVINDPLANLPPGAGVGLFLHEVLENMDFSNPDPSYLETLFSFPAQKYLGDDTQTRINKEIKATLTNMLQNIQNLKLNFPDVALRLNQVFSKNGKIEKNNRAVREMEFTLYFSDTEYGLKNNIFSLLQKNGLMDNSIPEKDFSPDENIIFRNGLLKGFIDLVFRYEERYYILDWKSNHLGYKIADYEEASLNQAMIKSNYYLQAYLYTLALDRYLAMRLQGDYDYEKHFGGFAYIFVRGIPQKGTLIHRPSSQIITALRELL